MALTYHPSRVPQRVRAGFAQALCLGKQVAPACANTGGVAPLENSNANEQ